MNASIATSQQSLDAVAKLETQVQSMRLLFCNCQTDTIDNIAQLKSSLEHEQQQAKNTNSVPETNQITFHLEDVPLGDNSVNQSVISNEPVYQRLLNFGINL